MYNRVVTPSFTLLKNLTRLALMPKRLEQNRAISNEVVAYTFFFFIR